MLLFILLLLTKGMWSAEVVATLNLGFQSESMEFDGANEVFWMVHENNVVSITSNISLIIQDDPQLKDPALSNGDFELIQAAGMVSTGKYLFVNDQTTGNMIQYDIKMRIAIHSVHILNIFDENAQLNGLCVDYSSDMNMLYITSPGIDFREQIYTNGQGIWSINIDTWEIKNIYNINVPLLNDYKLHPNGCVVVDGIFYAVDTRLDGYGAFIVYDINNDILSYNNSTFNISADGLTFDYQNNIFYTTSATGYTLQSIYKYQLNGNVNTFQKLIGGFSFPAGLSFNPEKNLLAVPEIVFMPRFKFVEL